jgi:hypothetical protein
VSADSAAFRGFLGFEADVDHHVGAVILGFAHQDEQQPAAVGLGRRFFGAPPTSDRLDAADQLNGAVVFERAVEIDLRGRIPVYSR